MLYHLISFIIAIVMCFITHEGGHYIAALYFKKRLQFRFAFGKFYVPRFIWSMPSDIELWKQKIIAISGFAFEIFISVCLYGSIKWAYMAIVCAAHLAAYKFYAGNASDFQYFFRKK